MCFGLVREPWVTSAIPNSSKDLPNDMPSVCQCVIDDCFDCHGVYWMYCTIERAMFTEHLYLLHFFSIL
ncbi:hypothetical protein VTN96DRAFT_4599 [Rasamsonia emersonii]